jgi:hypothetical protein
LGVWSKKNLKKNHPEIITESGSGRNLSTIQLSLRFASLPFTFSSVNSPQIAVMGDMEMTDASVLATESLDQRIRRRMPSRAEEILATLRENSITMLEIQHGITASDLMNELGLSEDDANAVVLEEASWKQKTDAPDLTWLDSVVDQLPSHFDDGMKQKVRFAISNAGIRNVDELRGMTTEDLARAKVPLAARGWLSDHYNRRVAAPTASAAPEPPSEFLVLPTAGGVNPKLVLNSCTGKALPPIQCSSPCSPPTTRPSRGAGVADAVMLEALVGMGFPQPDATEALIRTDDRAVQVPPSSFCIPRRSRPILPESRM